MLYWKPSSHLAFRTGSGQPLNPAEYCAQHAVDKAAGSIAAKHLGKLHGLVNSRLSWYVIIKQNLIVYFGQTAQHALDQLARELHHPRLQMALFRMTLDHRQRLMPSGIKLVQ